MKVNQRMPKNENTISFKRVNSLNKINPLVKDCVNYLKSHYNLREGAFSSYQQFKDILSDLLKKLSTSKATSKEDKYNQKGILGNMKKLKNLIFRICSRIISIVTSIGFQPIFFLIGLFTTQSVVTALIASSIYWVICLIIKSTAGNKLHTNKWFEPSDFMKLSSEGSIVKFLRSIKETINTTVKDIFNWFFLEITDEKTEVKFNRRMLLLTLIVFVLLYIVW